MPRKSSTTSQQPKQDGENGKVNASVGLLSRINGFFRGLHNLEAYVGNRILDHDICPEECPNPPVYRCRESALDELTRIIAEAEKLAEGDACNRDFLRQKLIGTAAYIRALLGEQLAFNDYIQQTMGFTPSRIPDNAIAKLKQKAVTALGALNVKWTLDAREKLFRDHLIDIVFLALDLNKHFGMVTPVVRERLKLSAPINLKFGQRKSDDWWDFWIETIRGQPTTLIINSKKNHNKTHGLRFGAHEIDGHALHLAELINSASIRLVDSPALNITTFSCEAFHMEGLAAALLELGVIPKELDPLTEAAIALYHFNTALEYNLYFDFENDRPPRDIENEIRKQAPFWGKSWTANAQARKRDPMNRTYLACYWPAYELFMNIQSLDKDVKYRLLNQLYTTLLTPSQIGTLIAAA